MQTPTSGIPRSPQQAINTMSPGDRRVLNENELAQRWGVNVEDTRHRTCRHLT